MEVKKEKFLNEFEALRNATISSNKNVEASAKTFHMSSNNLRFEYIFIVDNSVEVTKHLLFENGLFDRLVHRDNSSRIILDLIKDEERI